MSIFEVGVIGTGRLGGALALALSRKGYRIKQLIGRDREKARQLADSIFPHPEVLSANSFEEISVDLLFIATQDSEIQTVAEKLANELEQMPFVYHTSGSRSADSLNALREGGYDVASFHPLVSVSDAKTGADAFDGAYFCLDGDPEALKIARIIVGDLGGKAFSIDSKQKALYHASAVLACGHLVSLFSVAEEALSKCGLNESQAREILVPLVKSTTNNLAIQSPSAALTGPFARADIETVKLHIDTLSENLGAEKLKIYLQLGLQSLAILKSDDKTAERAKDLRSLLTEKLTSSN